MKTTVAAFARTILLCRRTLIAIGSITCLTVIGLKRDKDVAEAIAAVSIGLAAANSYERSSKAKAEVRYGAVPPA